MTSQWMGEKQVAAEYGIGLQTLRNHRHQRTGIPYYKIGRGVRYKRQDIEAYFESKKIVPENN